MKRNNMINKPQFFQLVRHSLFGGKLSKEQVLGLESIIDEYEAKYSYIGLDALAYVFATAYHEVDKKMKPIEEYGKGKSRDYGIFLKDKDMRIYGLKMGKGPGRRVSYYNPKQLYYGRGIVQLTWYENYEKAGKKLNIELLNNPELALDLKHATVIMFLGMIEGWFTTRKLSGYFGTSKPNYIGARAIINGKDKQNLIAGYALKFRQALS